MSLVIDHFFCFCEPILPEVKILEDQGFVIYPGNVHAGQGTANRAVIFESNYFEMLYLNSESEAQTNPLKMNLRANWKASGASPFGIALRGTIPDIDMENFWDYCPPYNKDLTIKMHKYSDERPDFPLLFVMPPLKTVNQENLKFKSFHPHKTASTKILKIDIKAPFVEWPMSVNVEGLNFHSSTLTTADISVDGNAEKIIQLNEILTLTII